MSATITLNGEPSPLAAATIAELLAGLGIEPGEKGVAVAVNGGVVPKREWQTARLDHGDAVEVVRPFSGG